LHLKHKYGDEDVLDWPRNVESAGLQQDPMIIAVLPYGYIYLSFSARMQYDAYVAIVCPLTLGYWSYASLVHSYSGIRKEHVTL
jgi:hypothetical protein